MILPPPKTRIDSIEQIPARICSRILRASRYEYRARPFKSKWIKEKTFRRGASLMRTSAFIALGLLYSGLWAGQICSHPPLLELTRPYLTVMEAPSLRFSEAIPRRPISRAADTVPPPELKLPISSAGISAKPSEPKPSFSDGSATTQTQAAATKDRAPATKPILPDETRSRVRAEDILPFFRYPGSDSNQEDVSAPPSVPQPGAVTPSSATYRQQ